MRNIKGKFFTLLVTVVVVLYACSPQGSDNSTKQNSQGEGAIDSTKIPHFDSATSFIIRDNNAGRRS